MRNGICRIIIVLLFSVLFVPAATPLGVPKRTAKVDFYVSSLGDDSAAYELGFRRIPIEKIGLLEDFPKKFRIKK